MTDQKPAIYDASIASAVLEHVSGMAEKLEPPVSVAFEELTAAPGQLPRIMLQPLRADAAEHRYVSGGAMHAFPFAVTLRVATDCEQDSLDADQTLRELARAWGAEGMTVPGYSVFRQQQLTTPTCLGRAELFEDWQVTLELKYKRTA